MTCLASVTHKSIEDLEFVMTPVTLFKTYNAIRFHCNSMQFLDTTTWKYWFYLRARVHTHTHI